MAPRTGRIKVFDPPGGIKPPGAWFQSGKTPKHGAHLRWALWRRRSAGERLTSLRSCLLRRVLTSTVVKYRGFDSKAVKAGSKGRPARLLPRPSMGIKPAGGGGCSLTTTALQGQ
ncbi:MAG: hypothetical protein LBP88_07345 [Treponema sp.]|nr:hypothetical protein [Treponema sp.]